MNLLLKNNSYRLFFLLFLMMVFNSCVSSKKQVPAPNLNMVNKIQFDTESKEIWAFDFKGQEHYFSKSTKKIIETFNSKTENINAQTIQLYCNYHTSDEILIIGEKKVSVFQTETKVVFDQKNPNINSTQSSRGVNSGSPNISGQSGIKSGGSSGGSGGSGNSKTTIPVDKKN